MNEISLLLYFFAVFSLTLGIRVSPKGNYSLIFYYLKEFSKSGIIFSIELFVKLLKASGPEFFFQEKFLAIDSISLMPIGLK